MTFRELDWELAAYLESYGLGVFSTTDPDTRTIFAGEMPADVNEGLFVLPVPSPPPHKYVDIEYPVYDFWARSAHSDRAYALLRQVFEIFHRRYAFTTGNWYVHYSQALGNVIDVDRDIQSGKLLRLSIQFHCRNLNHVS